uniref:DNA-directed RNA polymerase specialized sigma subunit, sigma24 family n=1 Tax=Candidatus Kentrum sp. DK TaxID=2126562 RepID=A0A450SMM7_9GAMM|nr:MAG: DNA-directed RNA polymerase specialized sigma subunit, sigma24 family [Candidatus Kentron sp. DK]
MDDKKLRELLPMAKKKDERATHELFRDLIYPVSGKSLASWKFDPGTHADLVQDAAINVLKGLPEFRGKTVGEIQSFVWIVGKRVAIDYIKKKGKKPEEIPLDELCMTSNNGVWLSHNGDDPSVPIETEDLIRKALNELERQRPDCLKTLTRIVTECESIRELAKKIGRTGGATRVHLHGCRKRFKAILKRLSG